jgi:hypothetical protein
MPDPLGALPPVKSWRLLRHRKVIDNNLRYLTYDTCRIHSAQTVRTPSAGSYPPPPNLYNQSCETPSYPSLSLPLLAQPTPTTLRYRPDSPSAPFSQPNPAEPRAIKHSTYPHAARTFEDLLYLCRPNRFCTLHNPMNRAFLLLVSITGVLATALRAQPSLAARGGPDHHELCGR